MVSTPYLQTYDIRYPAGALPGAHVRILHFGDLHWRTGSPGRLEDQVSEIIDQTPADLLVFTGDTVNRRRFWPAASRWLSQLAGPALRIAVPGNWDYSRGGLLDEFNAVWTEAGFRVLRNDRMTCTLRGTALEIVGLADVREDRVDWSLAETPPAGDVFRLLLSHNPDVLLARDRLTFNLLLCGHTHGGQVRLPGIGALVTSTRLGRKFDKGLFQQGPAQYVFITRGIGTGELPLRIFCPPEVALLTLGR